MKNKIFIILGLFLLASCKSHTPYYNRTKNELTAYYNILPTVIAALEADKYHILYSDTENAAIKEFMLRQNLKSISISEKNPDYHDTAIVFHKDYAPFFQNARTVEYDFGDSPLRNKIKGGFKNENGRAYKILDSMFIYCVDKEPAFGQ